MPPSTPQEMLIRRSPLIPTITTAGGDAGPNGVAVAIADDALAPAFAPLAKIRYESPMPGARW